LIQIHFFFAGQVIYNRSFIKADTKKDKNIILQLFFIFKNNW